MTEQGFSPAGRVLIGLASLVVVVAGMRAASSILVPMMMAVFLATISTPPLFWLQRRGLPTPLALLTIIALIVIVGLITAAIVGSSLAQFSAKLPGYQTQLHELTASLLSRLEHLGVRLSKEELLKYLDPGTAMAFAGQLLNGLSGLLTNVLLIATAVVFMLVEATSLPAKLRAVLPDPDPDATLHRFAGFVGNINQYLLIKTQMSLITGIIVTVALWLIGIDFAALWGWLAFFLNFVPYVGSIIAAFPPVMLALVTNGAPDAALAAMVFLAINLVIGNVVEPRLLGRGTGLSTVVVLVSLVFWGWALGPVGMFLSVPLTMLVKIAVESDPRTRWIGVLLSATVPPPANDPAS